MRRGGKKGGMKRVHREMLIFAHLELFLPEVAEGSLEFPQFIFRVETQ